VPTTRRALIGVGTLFFVNGLLLGSWLPRLPEIRDDLAVQLGVLGLTLSAGALGSLLGSSVSGIGVQRLGARRAAVGAAYLLLVVYPLIAIAHSVVTLGLVLASIGFLDSNADVGMNAVGVRVERTVGRSIMTRLHGVWSLGTLIGSGLTALAILTGVTIGRQLLIVAAAGAILVWWASRSIPEAAPRQSDGGRTGRLAIGLMVAGGAAVFLEGIPFDWSAIFVVDEASAGATAAGIVVLVFTTGMLAGRFVGDHVVDRFGPFTTIVSGIGLSVASMTLVVATRATIPVLIGFGLWGLGIASALPLLYKMAGSHPAFNEGSGLAALTVGTRIGFLLEPTLVGLGAVAMGLPAAIVIIVTASAALAVVALRLTLIGGPGMNDSIHRPLPS
jgi:predicted MFS family arabinose efflux permease